MLFICITLTMFAILTPTVGGALLRILKRHFEDFYDEIFVKTLALIVCQGLAFFARALFSLFLYRFYEEFIKWFNGRINEGDGGAVLYLLAQCTTECVPLWAMLLSVRFAVQEKIRV